MNGILERDLDSPMTETGIPKGKGWWPSRRQTRLILVSSLLVVVGLTVWARAVGAPPKLRFTNVAVFPVDPAHVKAVRNIDNRLGREVEIDFVPAGRFSVLLDLTNEGRRPVQIKDLPDEYDWKDARHSSFVRDGDQRRPEFVEEAGGPFTLSPGESVTVRYTFKFRDNPRSEGCMLSPNQTRELPVKYQKLGFSRTRWMPLQQAYLSTFDTPRCDESLKPVPAS